MTCEHEWSECTCIRCGETHRDQENWQRVKTDIIAKKADVNRECIFYTNSTASSDGRAYKESLLRWAADIGDRTIVEFLISHGANLTADINRYSLYYSLERGHYDLARYLISRGINVNTIYDHSTTAICQAARSRRKDIVELLLERGADVNPNVQMGPLTCAIYSGDTEVVMLLVARGAEINPVYRDAMTPLMAACYLGNIIVVEYLISNGADINAKHNVGTTPLMYGAKRGAKNIVELLISKGANVNTIDKASSSPLSNASEEGHLEVVQLLLAKGSEIIYGPKDILVEPCKRGYREIVELLISGGADLNAISTSGRTPLMAASESGHLETVKLLIEKGADISITSGFADSTALARAREMGHKEIQQFLIEKGAQ